MEWLRMHPYWAIAGVLALIVVGALFINVRSPVAPPGQTVAWSGPGALIGPGQSVSAPATSAQPPLPQLSQIQSSAPYTYISATPAQTGIVSANSSGTSFDFNAFIATLSQESAPKGSDTSAANSTSISSAYAFIPTGLISTSTPAPAKTPLQQALYEYGNNAGSFIQSFETEHSNEAQVVTDQAQDRTNPAKAAAVESLGAALSALGKSIANIDGVPPEAESANAALAQSYENIGAKLALVPQAQGDPAFLAAVQTYNAAADTFVKNYVTLANIFSSYGVTFAPSDPGSVFTFTPTTL